MKIDFNKIDKILIIQYQPFGDILLNTGYLPFLRQKFPNAKIDFLVRKPYHRVLEGNPFLDELIVFENKPGWRNLFERIKLFRRIRARRYDLIIDQIRGMGSAAITFFSGAQYRLGYKKRRLSFIYNVKVYKITRRYSAGMKFDLLKPLGIEEQPYRLYYTIKPESHRYAADWLASAGLAGKKLICFSPGSPVPRKKWSLANYAALADLILQRTSRGVILLWGPDEKEDVEQIQQMMKEQAILAPPTDFNQAAALLQQCELLVCNDGGINHLAVAVDAPSLAIFGSTAPDKWGAENMLGHYVLHNPAVDSRQDATFGISAEMAYGKILEIIS
ncbi:glycosyltransferase family 9 protein [candidate division KSB1 bacterium]|nr:glycosyltransferase family 9 protein [candidate division KSB1 bacterium]